MCFDLGAGKSKLPGSQAELPSTPSLQVETGKHFWGLYVKGLDPGLASPLHCHGTLPCDTEIVWTSEPAFEKCTDPQGIAVLMSVNIL
jgi:hypothetical protein